jgi:hypothetical protein
MELLGDVGHVKSHFGPFGNSVSVGAECTIGSKTIFDAPGGTPKGRGSCRISFQSVWRGVSVGAR